MSRIPFGEQAQNKSISIKPIKILEVFENTLEEKLKMRLSEGVSCLMIFFIYHKDNKKLLEELKKIKDDINRHKIDIKPSF